MSGQNDFLSGLLDRAFERAPVLERRRASLFEPTAGVGRMGSVFSADGAQMPDESTESNVESFEETPVTHSVSRPRRVAPPPGSALESRRDNSGNVPDSDERHSLHPAHPVAEGGEENRGAPEKAATASAQNSSKEVRDKAVLSPKRETRAENVLVTEAVVRAEALHPIPSPRAAQPAMANIESSRPEGPDFAPARPRPDSASAADTRNSAATPDRASRPALPTVTIQPAILPAPRAWAQMQRPPALIVRREIPAAPTIHVTIGRIEVRAASPTAPARAARTSEPKLTLQDYLQSRGGAGGNGASK